MRLKAKTAVSLPKEYLEKIKEIIKYTHKTRSQIITEALFVWFKMQELSKLENQYAEGYKKIPEDNTGTETLFKAGLQSFGKEKW